jgi:uncharacterized protein YndB with AHSA1/START domain
MTPIRFDPATDLLLERVVDVPRERIWRAWTDPEHLVKWWCPLPWSTVACEIDLRPGGVFSTTMRSPDGEDYPNAGCYLEVVPNQRLVWTDALLPGFRPSARGVLTESGGFYMTGVLTLESVGTQTRYSAMALHADTAGRDKHAEMGFQEGWGTVLTQLVAYLGTTQL